MATAAPPRTQSPLMMLRDALPQLKISNKTLAVYEIALRDIDGKTLAQAILTCLQQKPFLPHIAEIRQAAGRRAPPPDRLRAKRRPLRLNWWRQLGLSEQEIDAAIYTAESRAGVEHTEPWDGAERIAPAHVTRTLIVS